MPQMGAYHDDAIYLESAQSLAEGRGYKLLSLPDAPYQTKYPPVLPLLLSLVWRLDPHFPGNLSKLLALCWAMLPIYAFLLYRVLLRWEFAPLEAAAICVVTALSPHFVLVSTMTMSEMTFGVLSLVAIIYLERGTAESNSKLLMLAGAAGGLAFLTRTQGIALLIGSLLFFAWKKQWRNAAAYGAVFGIAVAGWFLWTHAHAYQGTDPVTLYYVDYVRFYKASVQWKEIPELVRINVDSMMTNVAHLLFAYIPDETLWRMFAWVVAVASLSGLVRLVKKTRQYHFAAFALVSFVLLLPWNFPPNERYLLPVWPAIAAGFYTEIRHLFESCRTVFRRPEFSQKVVAAGIFGCAAAACYLLLVSNYNGTVRDLPAIFQGYAQATAARAPAYKWIRENLPQDAQLLTYDDPLLYLFTGRRGLAMPPVHWIIYGANQRRLRAYFATVPQFMREHNLEYALTSSTDFHRDLRTDGREAFQTALNHEGWFDLLLPSPGAQVYRLKADLSNAAAAPNSISVADHVAGLWWASVRESTPAIQ